MTSWVSRVSKLKEGDTVCIAASFMRQVGIYDAETANARGTVKQIIPGHNNAPDRAVIDWRGADVPERITVGYLTKVTARGIHEA